MDNLILIETQIFVKKRQTADVLEDQTFKGYGKPGGAVLHFRNQDYVSSAVNLNGSSVTDINAAKCRVAVTCQMAITQTSPTTQLHMYLPQEWSIPAHVWILRLVYLSFNAIQQRLQYGSVSALSLSPPYPACCAHCQPHKCAMTTVWNCGFFHSSYTSM